MTPARVVTIAAAAQVGQVARRMHRVTVARWISFSAFAGVVCGLGAVLVALAVGQSVRLGAALGGGAVDGPMLLAGLLYVGGAVSGSVLLVSRDLWSLQVLAERERLAVLPLGRGAISALALLPTALPALAGATVGALAVLGFCAGASASPVTPLATFAAGVATALALGLAWTAVARLPGLGRLRPGVATALGVGALVVHAAGVVLVPDRVAGRTPFVAALELDEELAAWQVLLAVAALAALAWLTLVVAPPTSRRRSGSTGVRVGASVPAAWRVPMGVCSTIARQSSLLSEVGVAAAVCAASAAVAARMDALGRPEAVGGTLLVVAAFSALPVLGLRSTLGPTHRLWQLGARPADVRRGFVLAAVLTQAPGVGVAATVLVATSSSASALVLLLLLSVVALGVATVISNVLREVTDASVGRAAAGAALVVPALLALQAGAARAEPWTVAVAAALSCLAGLAVLRVTVSERVLT